MQRQEDTDTWLNCEQLSLVSVANDTEFEKLGSVKNYAQKGMQILKEEVSRQ